MMKFKICGDYIRQERETQRKRERERDRSMGRQNC
jgi:hypothetical protein